jgi:hypothetical protein
MMIKVVKIMMTIKIVIVIKKMITKMIIKIIIKTSGSWSAKASYLLPTMTMLTPLCLILP